MKASTHRKITNTEKQQAIKTTKEQKRKNKKTRAEKLEKTKGRRTMNENKNETQQSVVGFLVLQLPKVPSSRSGDSKARAWTFVCVLMFY